MPSGRPLRVSLCAATAKRGRSTERVHGGEGGKEGDGGGELLAGRGALRWQQWTLGLESLSVGAILAVASVPSVLPPPYLPSLSLSLSPPPSGYSNFWNLTDTGSRATNLARRVTRRRNRRGISSSPRPTRSRDTRETNTRIYVYSIDSKAWKRYHFDGEFSRRSSFVALLHRDGKGKRKHARARREGGSSSARVTILGPGAMRE